MGSTTVYLYFVVLIVNELIGRNIQWWQWTGSGIMRGFWFLSTMFWRFSIVDRQIDGETMENSDRLSFPGLQNHCRWWLQPWHKRPQLLGRKPMTNLDSILKSRNTANKGPSSQSYGFSSSHVWMWELDYKESWAPKKWCFSTVVLEKTLESPLDCKEIQPVHPRGAQSWVFIGKTDAEAETPVLWPPDVKNWLIGKDPDAGKDWRWEEKGTTEDEMVGWHHWLNGHEFE